MSAAGALMSELSRHFQITRHISTAHFDFAKANEVLEELSARAKAFLANAGEGIAGHSIDWSVEGHYPSQVWDIEAPLKSGSIRGENDVAALVEAFHAAHEELFAFADHRSAVEIVSWQAHVRCRLRERGTGRVSRPATKAKGRAVRRCYFPGTGYVEAPVSEFDLLKEGARVKGPAIVESALTTVVVNPGVKAVKTASGSLLMDLTAMK